MHPQNIVDLVISVPRNLTISLPDELAKEMENYPEVDWSEVCRQAIEKYVKMRKGVPDEVEQGLTFEDFLKELGITPTLFSGYSRFMQTQLRDDAYPRWYFSKKEKLQSSSK
jgi:hypothetical protein